MGKKKKQQKTKITNSFYFKATSSCVLGVHFASHTAEDLQMFSFEVCQSLESVNIQFTWMIYIIFFFFLRPHMPVFGFFLNKNIAFPQNQNAKCEIKM